MFWCYHDPRRPDPGDLLGSFLVFLVIFGFIAALVVYVGSIILTIFLCIGVAIGFIYALIVYVQSFIDACKGLKRVSGKSGFGTFMLKWWELIKTPAINALKSNFSVAHSAILRAGGYKFLSFKKWMWLIVAPSVLIFGTMMILAIALLQIWITVAVFSAVLTLLITIFAICLAIGAGYALFLVLREIVRALSTDMPFSAMSFARGYSFSDLMDFVKEYFSTLFSGIKTIFTESVALYPRTFSSATSYAIISPIRYLLLASLVAMMPFSLALIAVLFVVFSVFFILLFIIEFFWTLIALIIK